MNFPLYIAKRYIVSNSKNNAINIINRIASMGIIVGAMALFVVLSVFSGLKVFSLSFTNDIDSPEKALHYKNEYGIDGIMIGRAAIGYPWIFNEIKHYFKTGEHLAKPTVTDRVEAVRNHLTWAMEWKGERLGIVETRPHYTNYFKGIHSFKPYKQQLVTLDRPEELFAVLNEIEQEYAGYEVV